MTHRLILGAAAVAALLAAGATQAATTIGFSVSGDGITASGKLAYGADTVVGDPATAQSVTGASGTFSDSNIGMANWTITGVVATSPQPEPPPFPISMSFLPASGSIPPAIDYGALSFDNLLYLVAGGSPDVCGDGQHGGSLDVMGLMLTVQSPDKSSVAYVDIWSDGGAPSNGPIYGVGVVNGAGVGVDYQDWQTSPYPAGITMAVPEPGAWALMLLGFGGVGAAVRSRRRTAATQA